MQVAHRTAGERKRPKRQRARVRKTPISSGSVGGRATTTSPRSSGVRTLASAATREVREMSALWPVGAAISTMRFAFVQ
jgi:hypothetical protein